MESISGSLKEIRFNKNNYLIGILHTGVSVKGNMIAPQVGMSYDLHGTWVTHPRFGKTFIFQEYKANYPVELSAVRAYLQENCKWIGPEISKQLVNKYGNNTLRTCKEKPEIVAKEISGITKKRALEISAMLKNNEANEELQIQLKDVFAGVRVSTRVISKIIEKYKQDAPAKIKENPYRLIDDINGIGFLTADEVALKVGFDRKSDFRIQAGINHVLKMAAQGEGHTCLPMEMLLERTFDLLSLNKKSYNDDGLVSYQIISMANKKLLIVPEKLGNVYLPHYLKVERLIVEKLKNLMLQPADKKEFNLDGLMEDQVEAIKMIERSGVFILTGAPGTGKTYLVKRIIGSYLDKNIALAAPTGKAAKRMTELGGIPASTIHKLLEPQKDGDKFYFTRNAGNPLRLDLLIIDESSMIDVNLMASLMDAVMPNTKLIMIGDTYQLPPVGPGNVLRDMIQSGQIPYYELSIIKRQDPGLITLNCHHIKDGQDIQVENGEEQDFIFMKRQTEGAIKETIINLVTERLPKSLGIDPMKDIQVISPLREKTTLSCKWLNLELQKQLNRNPVIEKCPFKIGDKVIQTKNQYEFEIINGDIGRIQAIDIEYKAITVDFSNPDRQVDLPLFGNHLELAYAITCHKFQGSEAPIIIIPIHNCFGSLIMQRSWIYTAISRAQKLCIVVGQREEIPKIIRRNKQLKRYTGLKRFLMEGENDGSV